MCHVEQGPPKMSTSSFLGPRKGVAGAHKGVQAAGGTAVAAQMAWHTGRAQHDHWGSDSWREPGRCPRPAVKTQARPSTEVGGEVVTPTLPQDVREDPAREPLPDPLPQVDCTVLFSRQVCRGGWSGGRNPVRWPV